MKLQDLYDSVSQLGFEESLGDDAQKRFVYAANRALLEINSLRPRRKSVTINHVVPENLLFTTPTQIEKTETLQFTAHKAKSYYFEVCGKGKFSIWMSTKNANGQDGKAYALQDVEFDTHSFTAFKGIILHNGAFVDKATAVGHTFTGDVIIKFDGDFDYTIRNLAMYGKVYSEKDEDVIPYGNEIAYQMKQIVDDFEKFDSSPLSVSSQKYLNSDYSFRGSDTILLPYESQGVYKINYIHSVKTIPMDSVDYLTFEIDLDEDLAAMMPNLVAAYVWLDDESEKAQYYLNLYQMRAAEIKQNSKDVTPITFQSAYGW